MQRAWQSFWQRYSPCGGLLAAIAVAIALFLPATILRAAAPTHKVWVLKGGPAGLIFRLSSSTGRYSITCPSAKWTFAGHTAVLPAKIKKITGTGTLGKQITLQWRDPTGAAQYQVSLCLQSAALIFSASHAPATVSFPVFSSIPANLMHLSLSHHTFTPPQFKLAQSATPWVFFNRKAQTCIFAPASEIMVSKMIGDGRHLIASGFNPGVVGKALLQPHLTLFVFGDGIGSTIRRWGTAYRQMNHRPATSEEFSPILRNFGYWTDNGAAYFYNYDLKLGYCGTLLKIASEFRHAHIHLGYMELDSWWYRKSDHFFNGQKVGPMNRRLPTNNRWNYFGGAWQYTAAHQLFPNGLAAFHKQVGLPLAVHARWIARHSPYHKKYRISGLAAVDPAYWKSRANYLAKSGVIAYQQDWLVDIYGHSPQLHTHLSLAQDFTHGMAAAMAREHIGVMYCMETDRLLMDAGKLPDVMAMRGADDKFGKTRWRNFIYNSMFIHAIGAWPWSDVYMSRQRGNLLLSVLSGGPVGVGDPLGQIDAANIRMAIRADGRIVKPAVPLTPTDQTILNDARHKHVPLVATTWSGRAVRSTYVFVFRRPHDQARMTITPQSLGLPAHRHWIACNYFSRHMKLFDQSHPLTATLAPEHWKYWTLSPLLPSGMALLGDMQQLVPTGAERIENIKAIKGVHSGVRFNLIISQGESRIPISFYSYHTPTVIAAGHVLTAQQSSSVSHIFTVQIPVGLSKKNILELHKVVHLVAVQISAANG